MKTLKMKKKLHCKESNGGRNHEGMYKAEKQVLKHKRKNCFLQANSEKFVLIIYLIQVCNTLFCINIFLFVRDLPEFKTIFLSS